MLEKYKIILCNLKLKFKKSLKNETLKKSLINLA